jgi:hypothetical protein
MGGGGGGGTTSETTKNETINTTTTTTVGDIGFTGQNAVEMLALVEGGMTDRAIISADVLDALIQSAGQHSVALIAGAGDIVSGARYEAAATREGALYEAENIRSEAGGFFDKVSDVSWNLLTEAGRYLSGATEQAGEITAKASTEAGAIRGQAIGLYESQILSESDKLYKLAIPLLVLGIAGFFVMKKL